MNRILIRTVVFAITLLSIQMVDGIVSTCRAQSFLPLQHEMECGQMLFKQPTNITIELRKAIEQANAVFHFRSFMPGQISISKTDSKYGIRCTTEVTDRNNTNERLQEFVSQAQSVWYECQAYDPQIPTPFQLTLEKDFYIRFFDDHYFVDGILNKNFAYGTYPTEKERQQIISQFKEDILSKLK